MLASYMTGRIQFATITRSAMVSISQTYIIDHSLMQCTALKGLPKGQKVRIVEIGSGSGGTSEVVMAVLADLAERLELTYTDLSPQLVAYGQKTYGPRFPFAVFRQLDVEKSIEDQVLS